MVNLVDMMEVRNMVNYFFMMVMVNILLVVYFMDIEDIVVIFMAIKL